MAATSEIRAHHAHCVPHLARLHVLGSYQAGDPVPPGLAGDVSAVTGEILAEAGAAVRATVAAVPRARRPAVAEFLANRTAKLAGAAEQAVRAARDGDAAALRRCLRNFESLTSAAWTVQLAMPDRARLSRLAHGPQARLPDPVASPFTGPAMTSLPARPAEPLTEAFLLVEAAPDAGAYLVGQREIEALCAYRA
jgi:hypothetical protein